jgi:hypothetical protein
LLSLLDKFPGTLTAATWSPTARPGGFGQLDFTGGTGTVAMANSGAGALNFITGSFSVGLWFKSVAPTSVFVFKQVGSLGYQIVGVNTVDMSFTIFDGTHVASTTATGVLDGKWHHGLMSVNRELQTLHSVIDGKSISTTSTSAVGTLSNATTLRFGNAGGACSIDAVRIWNRPLTDQEAFEEYQSSRLGYPGVLARSNTVRGVASTAYVNAALAATTDAATMAGSLIANPAAPSSAALAATAGAATFAGSASAVPPPPSAATLAATTDAATMAAAAYVLPYHAGKQPDPRRSQPS